jgi:hypothetical protein
MSKTYTDAEIEAHANNMASGGAPSVLSAFIIRQLLAQRDEAVCVAEAYQKDCDRANAMLEETRAGRASAQSRIHALEEALKPFAAYRDAEDEFGDKNERDDVIELASARGTHSIYNQTVLTVGDFRRARSTLSTQKEGDAP